MPDRTASARAHVLVSGRVQGVGFRASAADEARRLGLVGSVRNLSDGRVEAVAEGSRPAVEAFVAWCRRGPRFGRVEDVAVTWEQPRGDARRFDIAG